MLPYPSWHPLDSWVQLWALCVSLVYGQLPAQVCWLSFRTRLQSQLPAELSLAQTWPDWLPVSPPPLVLLLTCSWNFSVVSCTSTVCFCGCWSILVVLFQEVNFCLIQVWTLYSNRLWRDQLYHWGQLLLLGSLASSSSHLIAKALWLQVYKPSQHGFQTVWPSCCEYQWYSS